METSTPCWLNKEEYPFESRYLDLPDGRMHYIDEGKGQPIVFVHGMPTWSFLYRRIIQQLRSSYRCIALDHLGFGLSGPSRSNGYKPADHARNLAALIERLELRDVVLVVHDFGGPIGLSYAVDHPENVAGVALFNTWLWSLEEYPEAQQASKLIHGPLGRFLYTRLNVSPRFLIKTVMGDKRKLTKEIHRHYTAPFPDADSRLPQWLLARELTDSGPWYDDLWRRRAAIAELPALLLWGMRDPTFKERDLQRWQALWPTAEVVRFANAGHFVQEEAPDEASVALRTFLQTLPVLMTG